MPIADLSDVDRLFLAQNEISVDRDPILDASGINDDFPTGRGVFFDENRNFVICVNM